MLASEPATETTLASEAATDVVAEAGAHGDESMLASDAFAEPELATDEGGA
jgi:hypothetical protein